MGMLWRRSSLQQWVAFLGRPVVVLLSFGVLTGVAVSGTEVVIVSALQAFLVVLGIAKTAQLPHFLADYSQNLTAVILVLIVVSLVRAFLNWAQVYIHYAVYAGFMDLHRTALVRWIFARNFVKTSEVTVFFNERINSSGLGIMFVLISVIQGTIALLLLGALAWVSLKTTVICLAASVVFVPPLRYLQRQIKAAGTGLSQDWSVLNDRLYLSIRNLSSLRVLGTKEKESADIRKNLSSYLQHCLTYARKNGVVTAAPSFVGVLLICLVAMAGKSYELLSGPGLLTFFYLFIRFSQALAACGNALSNAQFNSPQIRELFNHWESRSREKPRAIAISNGPRQPLDPRSPLGWELRSTAYAYDDVKAPLRVFSGFSETLPPGSFTLILGQSGAGKTTLLHFLLGELSPDQGQVLLIQNSQSIPLPQVDEESFLGKIGYVSSDGFFIHGTIRENLMYGNHLAVSEADFERALKLAGCEFVHDLPHGLGHHLNESGAGLSAGQKQRLALARALLRKPLALILDEATSHLDYATEERVIQNLQTIKRDCTIVAVSHSKSLDSYADRIIRLESKKIT